MPRPSARDQILKAGHETLLKRGFNGTSVQDITQAAGVPKGSFYNHFDSKEALGAEVLRRYVAAGRQADVGDSGLPPLARLRRSFERKGDAVVAGGFEYACMLGIFGSELANQCEEIRVEAEAGFEGWVAGVAAMLTEARAAGELPIHAKVDELATFLVGAWQGAVLLAKVRRSREPLQAFFDVTFQQLLV